MHFRSESGSTVVEVVVHVSPSEVVVHTKVVELDGSVTRVFGDGSGSSGTRSFSERYLTVPSNLGSTVVVHVHSRTSFRRCSGSRRGTRRFGAV